MVIQAVLGALNHSGAAGEMTRSIWQQANTIRVRREPPRATSRGKLPSLHADRGGARAESASRGGHVA